MIRIFIGYDSRERTATNLLIDSLNKYSSTPLSITLIKRSQLNGILWRKRGELDSTDFSISRFLTPYLSEYKGWSIFMDCDMLFRDDVTKLWNMRDEKYDVMVVKHQYIPKSQRKFDNEKQTPYTMKNWSSLMLFNNEKCNKLNLDYINSAPGLDLHQFKWTEKIGELPKRWNYLADEYEYTEDVSNIHFTLGGPWFSDGIGSYEKSDYEKIWIDYHEECCNYTNKIR
jgi:lipopolysaccharide biosynthesis glycosyltransferase